MNTDRLKAIAHAVVANDKRMRQEDDFHDRMMAKLYSIRKRTMEVHERLQQEEIRRGIK